MTTNIVQDTSEMSNNGSFENLVNLARYRAGAGKDCVGFIYLQDGETPSDQLTYEDLDSRARAIAATLQSQCAVGERVLLLYPSGLEFMCAFFGCLYAGCVAIPAYPPRRNRHDARLEGIVIDASPVIVLTTRDIADTCGKKGEADDALYSVPWIATDYNEASGAQLWQEYNPAPDSTAFIQYTSGSTSQPKGVCVSHFNLLHNLEDMHLGCAHDNDSVMVTWLPIHHDLGLIYGALQPLYRGFPCYMMPPASFLQRPLRWLEAISRFKGTHSAAPNFAFDLCVRAIEEDEVSRLDLSSMRMVLNAAEPIRAISIQRFFAHFANAGFSPTALSGGYGLAEATLKVSMVPAVLDTPVWSFDCVALEQNRVVPGGENGSWSLVGCGRTESDTEYIIVDPQTLVKCAADEVGEIWVKGPTIAKGYYNRPEDNSLVFNAFLADCGAGPYLRTGDLGFVYRDNLFVTGRIKDMIIIRGMNHYPHDIELTVEKACPELRGGCGAAFSIDSNGQERLVVVHELDRKHLRTKYAKTIIARMKEVVADEHGIAVHTVCLLRTNTIPKTTSGKIQRQACRQLFLEKKLNVVATRGSSDREVSSDRQQRKEKEQQDSHKLHAMLLDAAAFHLNIDVAEIKSDEPLAHYGLDSAAAVALAGEIERISGKACSPTVLYECGTIASLQAYLLGDQYVSLQNKNVQAKGLVSGTDDAPIAVVGMGCRFPGAESLEEFWHLLEDGTIATGEVPPERWDIDAYYDVNDSPGMMNTRWGGFLSGIDQFDAEFFGIAPREADYIDPQHRLLLEVSWEALENGAIRPSTLRGTDSGVFVGVSAHDYLQLQTEDIHSITAYTGTGGAHCIAANRLSYFWDLHGPSLAIDTACSSSLVAVHQAVTSLRSGECSLAIAGGVNAVLTPHLTVGLSKAKMMSPDGSCKVFDGDANGYVRGEGCGVVILKRMSDALADGNRIFAVIRGSAVRQDGKSNGLTAPNRLAQESVIRSALRDANLSPSAVSFVEAHGTGTALGDPIEVEAIRNVYSGRKADNSCRIGSVKANIGHLESAAGMAGLIKTILAMNNGIIPGNTRLRTLNPLIDIGGTPMIISPDSAIWEQNNGIRTAGVSSFGFGGTIAHTIVSEFDAVFSHSDVPSSYQLCTVSAHALPALKARVDNLVEHILMNPGQALGDICYTLNQGREHFDHKRAIVAGTVDELQLKLRELKLFTPNSVTSRQGIPRDVVFLFSGQGLQLEGVARELLQSEPVFRACIDECDLILRNELNISVKGMLEQTSESSGPGLPTDIQPLHFSIQYALAQLWLSWGIAPSAVLGHSLGEYAAACIAGVLELQDALVLVAHRARLAEALPVWGAMAAVFSDVRTVEHAIEGTGCEIAVINGPEHIIVSGSENAIHDLLPVLENSGLRSIQLKVTHGFHSTCVDPMLDAFEEYAAKVTFTKPRIEMFSTLTGDRVDSEIADSGYWRRHLREPVQFEKAMCCALEKPETVFIEIGSSPTLINMARRFDAAKQSVWIPTLRPGINDQQSMLEGLAQLYTLGHHITWDSYYSGRAYNRISLPTYPFQRKRHWITTPKERVAARVTVEHPLLGNRLHLAQPDGRIVWENVFSERHIPYLKDHVVNGVIVFPGAAFTEMIAYAARSSGIRDCIDISNLEFSSPLVFTGNARHRLQTVVQRAGDALDCAIYSMESDAEPNDNWRLHVRGTVTGTEFSGRVVSITDVEKNCPSAVKGTDFYSDWQSRGNHWGTSFQSIQRLSIGPLEAVAWLQETVEVTQDAGRYVIHPALLDACVQTMSGGAEGAGAFVGNRVGRLHIAGPLEGELIAYARWTKRGARSLVGDLTVTDVHGQNILMAEDLAFSFLEEEKNEHWRQWLFTEEWAAFQLPATSAIPPPAAFLVVGSHSDYAESCVEQLQGLGHRVLRLDDCSSVVPTDAEQQVQGILCFASPENELYNSDAMARAIVDQVMKARQTVQLIAQNPAFYQAKIWFVTSNVWPVSKGIFPQSASSLWGLYSAIAAEHSGNRGGLIDIEEGTDPVQVGLQISRAVTGGIHCDKLRIGRDVTIPRLRAMKTFADEDLKGIRSDGAYFITGGFGKLGSSVALWLAAQGARNIILIGRNGPPAAPDTADSTTDRKEERFGLIEQLEETGVNVTSVALDINDVNALKLWEKDYRRQGNAPVKGIFHVAGVVSKEALEEISEDACLSVVKAKAGGVMALEQVFDLRSMDFVALFSSAATIINSPFLGAYAAANAFLDSYAQQRRLEGCPVISIDWSTFKDGGMAAVAEQAGDANFSRTLKPLSSDDGMLILRHLLGCSAARVAVLPVVWEEWQAAYPSQSELVYWEHVLAGLARHELINHNLPDRVELLNLPHEKRHVLLVEGLSHLVSHALGAGKEGVDPATPLTALGIDSLMALEIRACMEKAYGVTLPVVTIISGPSIEMLAQSLGELLDSQPILEADDVVSGSEKQNETGFFPLSFNQYSQWLLSSMSPKVCAYHVSFSARLISVLDKDALQHCLQALVERHASLRTTYTVHNGEISQEVHESGDAFLIETDATGWSDEELLQGARKAYAQPFDLVAGPLIRGHLFTRSASDHVFLLVVHHIGCDGWSLWLLLEELATLYAAETGMSSGDLPSLGASYITCAKRQLEKWSGTEELRAGQKFWAERLADIPLMLELVTDYPRPLTQTLNGSSRSFSISSSVTHKLKRMASEQNTTMFTLLMAAYHVLLHRITSQTQILVGSPTAGRTDSDTARTVGHFVNMIVIRGDLTANPSWREFVEVMRREIIECLEFQDFPFHLLVEHLQPERLPGRTPVFQVDFTYQRAHTNAELIDFMGGTSSDTRLHWGTAELAPFVVPQQEGQFDLSLEMAEGAESLFGFMKYNSDLFRPETIDNLCRSLCMIVESVCDSPELHITDIPLLDSYQLQTVNQWAQSITKEVPDRCLHELFAVQASLVPHEQALVCGNDSLTYRKLHERSDAIAWCLQDLGVASGSIVGVCLERSTDLIASLLAVLKAGGAYLPLDVTHPESRRREMLIDSGAGVLITAGTAENIAMPGVRVCDPASVTARAGQFVPKKAVYPTDLAYVIYTSGSTGKPKGVMIEHKSVVNLITGLNDFIYSKYESGQHVSVFASTVFDASVQQIFGALCGGHTLHVLTEECRRDGKILLDYWRQSRVTIADGTPTLLGMMLDAGLSEVEGLSLKHLIIGGEPLSRELVSRFKSGQGSDISITNIYGPTECCVDVTAMDLDLYDLPDEAILPIGRPMANVQAYILNQKKKPVVPGMPGELYIGGPSVGRGYLNQAERTAECFVTNTFEPGTRLYRTGDRVRFLPDGVIAFLGRVDNQVKVRGFRIEPGEIEHRLRCCTEVRDAVVIVREDIPGDRRLVAYLIVGGEAVSTEDIRGQLVADLPDYMIPSLFVVMSSFPLSSSGKVDRRKLPKPAEGSILPHTISAKPQTDFEREVASIWKNIIGLKEVGLHDNFFDLGGNSLLLTKVQISLQAALGRDIGITELFRFPTIHSLAEFYAKDEQALAEDHREEGGRRQQQKRRAAGLGSVRRSIRKGLTETEV